MADFGLARLALGVGIAALLIQISDAIPRALAWPAIVAGAGLWLAAAWEARSGHKTDKFSLVLGALALAAAGLNLALSPGSP